MGAADRVFRIAVALAPPSAGACRAGSVVLAAKLIAGHDAEGERRGTPARTIRMPPGSSIWIPGRRWAPARIIQRAGPRQAAMPGNAAAESAATAQAATAQAATAQQ